MGEWKPWSHNDDSIRNRQFEWYEKDYENFARLKDELLSMIAYFQSTIEEPEDTDELVQSYYTKIGELLYAFQRISGDMLGRTGAMTQGIEDWLDFVTIDAAYQENRVGQFSEYQPIPMPKRESLRNIALSYIKNYGLDVYNELELKNRDDLHNSEWITDGYLAMFYRRTIESLKQGNPVIRERIIDVWEAEAEESLLHMNTDSKQVISFYTDGLYTISESTVNDMNSLEYGPPARYMQDIRHSFEHTELYKMLFLGAQEIQDLEATFTNSHYDEPDYLKYNLLSNDAFLNGFAFGMAVNNKLVKRNGETLDLSEVDVFLPALRDFIERYKHIASKGENIDKLLAQEAYEAFFNNIAHPDEPYADEANLHDNPLNDLADTVTSQLYDPENSQINIEDFNAGFGIARKLFNTRRKDIYSEVDSAFNHA